MKNFLEKYNAFKIETSKDEGKLTLETAKERILKLLTDNIRNFKEEILGMFAFLRNKTDYPAYNGCCLLTQKLLYGFSNP